MRFLIRNRAGLTAPLVFGLVYFLALLGRRLDLGLGVALGWMQIGVAVGVVAIGPRRHLVALLVADLAASLLTGAGIGPSVASALSNLAAVGVGAAVLREAARNGFGVTQRLRRLIAAAVSAGAVGGGVWLALMGLLGGAAEPWAGSPGRAVTNAVGVLVFAPAVVSILRFPISGPGWTPATRQVVVSAAAAGVVLGITYAAGETDRPLMYLTVPVLMLGAMQMNGRNLVLTLPATAVAMAAMTAAGLGPFAGGSELHDTVALQSFTAVMVVSALTVGAAHHRSRVLAEQMAKTLAAARNAVLVVGPDGLVTFCNPAAVEAFGARTVGVALAELVGAAAAERLVTTDCALEVAIATPGGSAPYDITSGRFVGEDGPSVVLVARDLSERRAAERRIRSLSAVVEASPSFIGFADATGVIQYLSPGARSLLGIGDAPMEGARLGAFAPEWAAVLMREVAIPAAMSHGHWRGESAYMGPDGEEVPVLQTVMAHRNEEGELEMLSTVAHDLSDRVRMERERSELVANLVHDLRNPLVAISGVAEILAEDAAAERGIEMALVEIVDAGAKQIRRLVDDLITGEKLADGSADRAPVDLFGLASAVVSLHLLPAARSSVTLEIDGAGVHVDGDAGSLHRMIENLVTNAVKYSPAGGRVRVGVERIGNEAVLSVSDEGIGIEAADIPVMFERYRRGSTATSQGIGGTGLGLAICRQVAEQHGGAITVHSRPGSGSTFEVRLPASQESAVLVSADGVDRSQVSAEH